MEKNRKRFGPGNYYPMVIKFARIMKLTILFSILVISQALAVNSYSQSTRITLNMTNSSVKDVLLKIEKSSEFYFLYSNKLINVDRRININLTDNKVTEILDEVFRGTDVKYDINDRQIILKSEGAVESNNFSETQQKTVSGKVTDSSGSPLPGVTVAIKGVNEGTITDAKGQFSLSNVSTGLVLRFSFIGMKTQEIVVGSSTVINVILSEETVGIEEVVAVGYGTQKKINLTGSLASVGEQKLKSISTANLVTGLAGKLPGLRVTQWSGEPGSYSTVFDIRGYGTPLIVVDGIVRDDFARIDPLDIDNITVLKDASAAVYGVQAANGVILVTTKKGKIGKPVLNYSATYSVQKFTVDPQLTNAYQYATMIDEFEIAGGKNPGNTTFSAQDLQKYKDGTYPSTDWLGAIQKKYSTVSHHNLSISGGNDKVKYFTSAGYLNDGGIWKTDNLNYRKYNVNSSVTVDITDNLKAQLNLDGIMENGVTTSYASDNIYFTGMLTEPTFPIYANNNPQYFQLIKPINVVADIDPNYSGYTKTITKTFQGNFSLDYNFKQVDGLTAKFVYGFYSRDQFRKQWNKQYTLYNYDKITDTYPVSGVGGNSSPTSLNENYTPYQKSTVIGTLKYEKLFQEKHHLNVEAIYEARHEQNDNLYANKFFALDIDQLYAGLDQNTTATSSNIYENASQNVIGRLNYDYMSKYLFEVGFNYGGSSKFPAAKRWGLFPFTSVGWRLSEENFIKNNFSFITNLKLRASIGKMGDDGAAAFQFLTGYDYPSGNYVFGDQVVSGLGFRGMPNPNITWFTATTKNLGVDLDIYHGLFSLQFDVFQRDRSGLLGTRILSIPASVGANLPQENLNSDRQKGFELVIGHRGKIGEFTYNVSGNMTYTRRLNQYIERAPDGNSYENWKNNTNNRWSDMQWGYKYIGQYQTTAEILSSPIIDGQGNKTIRPGDLKYEDVNKDGIIDANDQIPIARSNIPNVNFGLSIEMAWKNFDMNVFFQGATGYSFNYDGMNRVPLRWGRNSLEQFWDRWHHENIFDVNSPLVPGRFPQMGYVDSDNWNSSFWMINGSYLRLKDIELGYTINKPFLKKAGIEKVRLSISGLNLFTLSNFENIDPEQHYVNWIFYSYPINKNITFGLNVTF